MFKRPVIELFERKAASDAGLLYLKVEEHRVQTSLCLNYWMSSTPSSVSSTILIKETKNSASVDGGHLK